MAEIAEKTAQGARESAPGRTDTAARILLEFRQTEDIAAKRRTIDLLNIFGDKSVLTPEEQKVFSCRVYEQKTVRETEALTGVSKSNVQAIAERACRKLHLSLAMLRYKPSPTPQEVGLLKQLDEATAATDENVEAELRDSHGRRLTYEMQTEGHADDAWDDTAEFKKHYGEKKNRG